MIQGRYLVSLTGETPLLLHNDNLEWSDVMKKWGKDPANKKDSVAGDDRSPAWRWIGSLYVEDNKVVMSSDNLMTVLREGAAQCPTGKGKKTFKAQSQSGIVVDQIAWPLTVNSVEVPYEPIYALIENPDFEEHKRVAKELGFELFAKRARIGQQKHVRVRPRFDAWECQGTLTVIDDMITQDVLQNIWDFAGAYAGLGDWRASSPKSGRFGKFTAKVKKL